MIEEKDVSPPCGKRHSSKNISNVNLSTQKKTGGKCIMGNQGMTNWKFSAFLAIALILIAGLFSSTAMAAANDGQGTIEITAITPTGGAFEGSGTTATLFANEAGHTITFTYTVGDLGDGVDDLGAIDMNGGLVQIKIPSGWIVPHVSVIASDGGETLVPTDADAVMNTAEETLNRIVLTKSGDNVTYVGIKLDAGWTVAADGRAQLTITFGTAESNVTTATPSSLFVPPMGRAYQEDVFRTRSMAKDGDLRPLVIGDDGANPQPRIRVGNVKSGSGQVDVSPIVYETETDRNIELIFTAAGPMYDTEGVNALITITAPPGLTDPQTADPAAKGFMTVSRQSGTVLFADPSNKIVTATGSQEATIDITRMEVGAKIYVAYRKVDAPAAGEASSAPFMATSTSHANPSDTSVTVKPDGNHLQALSGSGTITLTDGSDNVVAMRSRPALIFTFKAAVGLGTDGQTLRINQPDDSGWSPLVLQSLHPREENHISVSTGTLVISDGNISVTGVKLNKNASMTVRISRAEVDAPNGSYEWVTSLADTPLAAGSPSLLVASDAKESVTFSIIEMPDTAANHAAARVILLPHYPAAGKQNIRFRFKTTTPIKGGYVQFNIPSSDGWVQPSLTDVKGKATVKLVSWDAAADPPETLVTPAADADMTLAVSGNQITVNIKEFVPIALTGDSITVQYGIGTGDFQGMVQNRAQADLEILGRFKSGVSTRDFPAAAPASVRIGNVAAGSGTAMITSPSSHTVKAGSKSNNITIVYRAAGTMDGGSVRLHSPDDWGALQETDSSADNYIRVNASSSMVDQNEISYGTRYVLVPLKSVGANQSISFIFNNVKAQKGLGLAKFTVSPLAVRVMTSSNSWVWRGPLTRTMPTRRKMMNICCSDRSTRPMLLILILLMRSIRHATVWFGLK